jgi:hypothetical protein
LVPQILGTLAAAGKPPAAGEDGQCGVNFDRINTINRISEQSTANNDLSLARFRATRSHRKLMLWILLIL